jgi:hypothetical protein
MATPVAPRPDAPMSATNGTSSADWTVQIADTIESVVGSVRDKTAVPLETVARGLVYGILMAVIGVTALVLVTIAGLRLLDYLLPMWAAYAIVGGLFTLLGLFLWRKRRPPRGDHPK